jgi:hypothetical protein
MNLCLIRYDQDSWLQLVESYAGFVFLLMGRSIAWTLACSTSVADLAPI